MNARRLSEHLLATATVLVLATVHAAGAEEKTPQWYEYVTGVIAIPVALIGLAYSYLLIKKTRLEAHKTELDSRKTELEILDLEKEHQTAQPLDQSRIAKSVSEVAVPARENRLILLLLLRFVVLGLIISSWYIVEDAFNLIFGIAVVSAQQVFSLRLAGWSVIPLMIMQWLPKIGYWLVFFSLAWPLFRDTNAVLGINIKSFFNISSLRDIGHNAGSEGS